MAGLLALAWGAEQGWAWEPSVGFPRISQLQTDGHGTEGTASWELHGPGRYARYHGPVRSRAPEAPQPDKEAGGTCEKSSRRFEYQVHPVGGVPGAAAAVVPYSTSCLPAGHGQAAGGDCGPASDETATPVADTGGGTRTRQRWQLPGNSHCHPGRPRRVECSDDRHGGQRPDDGGRPDSATGLASCQRSGGAAQHDVGAALRCRAEHGTAEDTDWPVDICDSAERGACDCSLSDTGSWGWASGSGWSRRTHVTCGAFSGTQTTCRGGHAGAAAWGFSDDVRPVYGGGFAGRWASGGVAASSPTVSIRQAEDSQDPPAHQGGWQASGAFQAALYITHQGRPLGREVVPPHFGAGPVLGTAMRGCAEWGGREHAAPQALHPGGRRRGLEHSACRHLGVTFVMVLTGETGDLAPLAILGKAIGASSFVSHCSFDAHCDKLYIVARQLVLRKQDTLCRWGHLCQSLETVASHPACLPIGRYDRSLLDHVPDWCSTVAPVSLDKGSADRSTAAGFPMWHRALCCNRVPPPCGSGGNSGNFGSLCAFNTNDTSCGRGLPFCRESRTGSSLCHGFALRWFGYYALRDSPMSSYSRRYELHLFPACPLPPSHACGLVEDCTCRPGVMGLAKDATSSDEHCLGCCGSDSQGGRAWIRSFDAASSPALCVATDASHSILDAVLRCLDAFFRSLGLLQLLAFVRLFLIALPFAKRSPRTNVSIKVSRRCLRGAPVALAFCWCVVSLQGMHAGSASLTPATTGTEGWPDIGLGSGNPGDCAHGPCASAVNTDLGSTTCTVATPVDEIGREPGTGGIPVAATQELAFEACLDPRAPQGRYIAVLALCLQRAPRSTSFPLQSVRNSADLIAQAEEELEAYSHGLRLLEVTPQPHAGAVVLLSVPHSRLRAAQVPVCIQLHLRSDPERYWLDYLDEEIRGDDVRGAIGPEWDPGMHVFVAGSCKPLGPSETCTLHPGILITVSYCKTRPPALSLTHKLRDSRRQLRDAATEGFLPDVYHGRVYTLLQLLEPPARVQYSPSPGQDLLEQVVVSHALAAWRPYVLHWPNEPVHDLHVRGVATCLVAGAFPCELAGRVPLFVDGRRVGMPMRLYAAKQGHMCLADLFLIIGLGDLDADAYIVTGSVGFDHEQHAVRVSAGDLMVLDFVDAGPPSARRLVYAGSDRARGAPLRSPQGGFTTQMPCRLPRDTEDAGDVRPPEQVAQHGASQGLADSVDSWGTPSAAFDPDPSQTRDYSAEGGESSSGESDDVLVACEFRPPDRWRIMVRVLAYQSAPKYDTLWVARGESTESWLARANMLLAPPGGLHDLVLPPCQPLSRCVCLLQVPKWWQTSRLHAVLLADVRRPDEAYVEVVREDDGLEDFLPLHGQMVEETLEVFRCLGPADADVPVPHPAIASTFLFQPEGRPPPTFVAAASYLQDHTRAVGPGHVGPQPVPSTWQRLLVGAGAAHRVWTLRPGPIRAAVAEATAIPVETLLCAVQRRPFPDLCVQGQLIHGCISYRRRNRRVTQEYFTLFFDARELGCPVCSAVVTKLIFTPEELLTYVGGSLPPGHCLGIKGGRPSVHKPRCRYFENFDSVVLWASPLCPSPRADSTDGDAPEDDGDQAGQTDGSRGRSRSPRRCAVPRGQGQAFHSHVVDRGSGLCDSGGMRSAAPTEIDRGDMWNQGILRDAPPTCSPGDTTVLSLKTLSEAVAHSLCRPVPTPCRSMCRTPVLDCGVFSLPVCGDHLGTLLDSAVRPGWDGVLVRALQVLDAAASGGTPCDANAASAATLHLAAHLPCQDVDHAVLRVPTGRSLQEVNRLLEPWPLHVWDSCLPAGVQLHPSSRAALDACQGLPRQFGERDAVQVFTDGSFDGSTSSWAVVCVLCHDGAPAQAFWTYGRVCTDATSDSWLGAELHGAQEAELSAASVALLWALSLKGCCAFGLRSDSLVTVHRAGGLWNLPFSNRLAVCCRCLAQACEAFGCKPWRDIAHISAHEGHAWNELADTLAKYAIVQPACVVLPVPIGPWVRDRSIEHLWLLLSVQRFPQCWPGFDGTSLQVLSAAQGTWLSPADYFGHPLPPPRRTDTRRWTQLRVVSMNVQTLEGGGVQAHEGRTGYLREQMLGLGAHVVAVQEARTPKTASVLSDSYIRLCSGRTASGQLGVELWFIGSCEHRSATP